VCVRDSACVCVCVCAVREGGGCVCVCACVRACVQTNLIRPHTLPSTSKEGVCVHVSVKRTHFDLNTLKARTNTHTHTPTHKSHTPWLSV